MSPVAAQGRGGPTDPSDAESGSADAEAACAYTFLSSPDFLNADIGDVRKSADYRRGDPLSDNARYRKALNTVFQAFVDEGVSDVAVAGDLVNGHWGIDTAKTGVFGPTDTNAHQKKAVAHAAHLYYGQWQQRFSDAGLRALPALGDHEIGDNPWRGKGGKQSAAYNSFKQRPVPFFKRQFDKNLLRGVDGRPEFPDRPSGPASGTAYAVRLQPKVELITLDVFQQTRHDVVEHLDPAQMQWLRTELKTADQDGVDWKIVQFHTPIIGPVREVGSSGLMYGGGLRSQLWRVLRAGHVNLILNGEVHAITTHQPRPGDPVQITHGGLFQFGLTNYLRISVDQDLMSITAKDFRQTVGPKHRLWQTDTAFDAPAWVHFPPRPYTVGTLTLTRDGLIEKRTGLLDDYRGQP